MANKWLSLQGFKKSAHFVNVNLSGLLVLIPPCMYLVQTTKTTRVGRPSHIFKVLTKVINCGSLPNWLSNAIVQKPSYSNGCTWRVVGPSNNSTEWQQQWYCVFSSNSIKASSNKSHQSRHDVEINERCDVGEALLERV